MGAELDPRSLPLPDVAERIRQLGGHPRRGGGLGSVPAWTGSALVHIAIAVAASLATLSFVSRREAESPVVTVLDFVAPSFDPVAPPPDSPAPEPAAKPLPPTLAATPADAPVQAAAPLPAEALQGLRGAPTAPPAAAAAAAPLPRLDPLPRGEGATFAGLRSSNARKVVYVVDASGSLVGTFPAIARELGASLARLDPRQSFAVIFFRRNEALPVPPAALLPATPANVAAATEWIGRHVVPAGRSNPLPALTAALALKPDVVFLLSADITGAGEFEIGGDELLAAVDRLNPASRSGRRPARIQCVEFLERDPDHILERLSEVHGGPGSFRFLSRQELGLTRSGQDPGVMP